MGKPLTEEHKKAISEALRKKYGTREETGRSAEAHDYLEKFVSSRVVYEDARSKREALRAQIKGLGRKKASKGARAKIKAQIDALSREMKTEREAMKRIKEEATASKTKKNAEINIKKAQAKISQYNTLTNKIEELIRQTSNPERRERLMARLERAKEGIRKQEMRIDDVKATASTGVVRSRTFNFQELSEFRLPRKLTFQEERTDFLRLNEQLDQQSNQFEEEMIEVTREEIARLTKSLEKNNTALDVATILALVLLIRGSTKSTVRKAVGTFYGIGAGLALREARLAGYDTGTGRPPVPTLDKQIMSTDSEIIAETYVSSLESSARSIIQAGIVAGATAQGVLSVLRDEMKAEASKAIANISGTITGEYLNRGRTSILNKLRADIVAFQRSEVLDSRTCAMCLSLDKRVVKPDDPMAQLELVHTHCRGFWTPIFEKDEEKPEITGIPKNITSRFKTIEGVPIINSFKQVKKPINDVSKDAQEKINERF